MHALKLVVLIVSLLQMCVCYRRCKNVISGDSGAYTACVSNGKASVQFNDKPAQNTSLQISFKSFVGKNSSQLYLDSDDIKMIISAIQRCMTVSASMCTSLANISMHQPEKLDLIIEESKDRSKFNVIGLGIFRRGNSTLSNKPLEVRIRVRRSDGTKSNSKKAYTIPCPKDWTCFRLNPAAPATTPCLIDIKRPVTCIVHMTAAPATPPSHLLKRSLRMISIKGIYEIKTWSVVAETIALKNMLQLVFESLKAVV